MARSKVARHIRSIRRAALRLRRRRIKPVVAMRLIGRSCWRIAHAIVVLILFLIVAATVLTIMASGTTVRKLRGYGDLARGK